jgi:hypothetical protein
MVFERLTSVGHLFAELRRRCVNRTCAADVAKSPKYYKDQEHWDNGIYADHPSPTEGEQKNAGQCRPEDISDVAPDTVNRQGGASPVGEPL